jgi:DNA-binding MarR family transcriptional regulator
MAVCEVVDGVRVAINRELESQVGLTLAENLVLCQVAMSPNQRLRMVEIAQRLAIGRSAVTKTVDRLEERDLLTRQRDATDRRTVYAALTKSGSTAFAEAQPVFEAAVNRHFTRQLDKAQLASLSQMTTTIIDRHLEPLEGSRQPRRSAPRGGRGD